MSSSSEVCADIISVFVYMSIGPKKGFASSYILASLGCLLLLCFPNNIDMIPFYVTIAKFGISTSFNMVYLASVGLIPTMFASSVFGLCNVAARILTILAPIIAEQVYPYPMIICFIASSLGIGIS